MNPPDPKSRLRRPVRRVSISQALRNAYLRFEKDPAVIAVVHRVLGRSRCRAALTFLAAGLTPAVSFFLFSDS